MLRPLAMMFVQIDELTYKTEKALSYRVFAQIERLIKEFVDYSGQMQTKDKLENQRNKKRQICDAFCSEYKEATN